MITQETRERMENIIKCIRAKLDGNTIQYQMPEEDWVTLADTCWDFGAKWNYRIAPEREQKLQRWTVMSPSGSSVTYDTLEHAKNFASADSLIIELTETARIEPKKREPIHLWINDTTFGNGYTFAYDKPEKANRDNPDNLPIIEFVEVVK